MEHHREIKNSLEWHSESGKFDATLTNGIITELNFCEPGTGPGSTCGRCLESTDYKYLKQVHQCLGELFAFIEEENKRLGYSYAGEKTLELQ
jgi:hypothetical protein